MGLWEISAQWVVVGEFFARNLLLPITTYLYPLLPTKSARLTFHLSPFIFHLSLSYCPRVFGLLFVVISPWYDDNFFSFVEYVLSKVLNLKFNSYICTARKY